MKPAFLFLVYDEILHETLWHDHFFSGVDKSRYSTYVHYKPELGFKTTHYRDKGLRFCTPTEWAKVSLLVAQNLLRRDALKDEENERFIFLSQSCLPVKSFDRIERAIYRTDKSFFNERPKEFARRYRIIETLFGAHEVYKQSAWCILNRKHAALMAARSCWISCSSSSSSWWRHSSHAR